MNVSAKTEYVCIAVCELAAQYGGGEPVRIRHIAETHGIPSRFLVQILLQLKSAGLVNSTRGAAGGYQLARDPREITLGEVMYVIEGRPGRPTSSADVETPISQTLLAIWNDVAQQQEQTLQSITFADVLERSRSPDKHMYYI